MPPEAAPGVFFKMCFKIAIFGSSYFQRRLLASFAKFHHSVVDASYQLCAESKLYCQVHLQPAGPLDRTIKPQGCEKRSLPAYLQGGFLKFVGPGRPNAFKIIVPSFLKLLGLRK